jgi:peptidoglycan biosynthesis protein MviN/MurJ (putative lipid II flippase)
MKIGGIALASSLAGTVDFLILFYAMNKRLGGMADGMLRYFILVVCASALTGVLVYLGWRYISIPSEEIKLAVVGGFGFLFYGIVGFMLNINQARKIWSFIQNGFGRKG